MPYSIALAIAMDERGATAIEYALIASLISIAILTAASTIGTSLINTFNTVSNAL